MSRARVSDGVRFDEARRIEGAQRSLAMQDAVRRFAMLVLVVLAAGIAAGFAGAFIHQAFGGLLP